MSITAAEFKIRFPEFVSETDERIELFIADSELILNESYWGIKYDIGLCYLTAHYLVLAKKSEAGSITAKGAVTSRTVDGSSVSYNQVMPTDVNESYYAYTTYGQRYLALRKTLGVPANVI